MRRTICRILLTFLIAALIVSLSACSTGKADTTTYTIWMASSESATYYSDHNENPTVKYWNSLQYKGESGEPVDVFMDFEMGVTGEAESFFNTMIATWEDQYDVIDLSQGAYSASQLYEDGILIDLTPYIDAGAMPNYTKWLDENPDYALTATNIVDGEPKYLQIYHYSDDITPWGGWQYRRDWIVKYGVNPSTGEQFTGGYDENGVWSDNVVFPSWYNAELKNSYTSNFDPEWDGTVPVFISDWEWMLKIFDEAVKAQGLSGGYAMNMWYPGYMENGSVISGFGGGSAGMYKDGTTAMFGGVSDNFRTYLQCLNAWYKNGWLDQKFTEHSSDIFYLVDTVNTFQGQVGLFYGTEATTRNKLEDDDFPATEGIYVAALREPINDVYGSGESGGQKYVPGVNEFIPDTFYQSTRDSLPIGLTSSLINNEKDVWALLSAIDYLYDPDGGALLSSAGLTAEQYATVAEEGDVFHAFGFEETGTYFEITDGSGDCKYKQVDAIIASSDIGNICKLGHFAGLTTDNVEYKAPESLGIYHEWAFYEAKGQYLPSFVGQLSAADAKTCDSITQNIRNYSYGEIPKFIMGTKSFDDDWNDYCKKIKRYGYENMVTIYQTLLDQFS